MDPVMLEILNTQIAAGAEEMALTLRRTARSLYVKEAVDFGVALVTPEGRLFGTPRDFGSALIDYDMAPALEALGEPLEDGDVLFTNHPYETAGLVSHTPDLTLICPYHVDGQLVAYGYSFVHSTDVGGKVPSSVSPTNTEMFQEGLLIPPVKLIRNGIWNKEILRIYRANVRTPDLNGHDLTAMLAALETGRRRVADMVAQHGARIFVAAQKALMDYAAEKARAVFRRIPDGTHNFHDFIDNDSVSPVPVRFAVSMTVTDGQVHLDFTASDPQVPSAFNVPTLGRRHAWLTVRLLHYVTTHDPSTPMNGGIFRDVTVALKQGTVLDPVFPAATGVRAASAYRLNDAVTGAFAKAVPDDMPCPSGGAMVPVVLAEHDRRTGLRNVLVLNSIIVGSGARKGSDGYDGVDGSLSTIRNTPTEKVEQEAGVDILEYGLNPDSAGPGQWRGGFGLRFTFRVTQPGSAVLARGLERFYFRPWGMAGGLPGANMSVIRNIGTDREVSLGRIDMVMLDEGDTVTFLTPGGGGYGDPFLRPIADVLEDVASGWVSVEAARRFYGVEISDGVADLPASTALRAARPLRDARTHPFDFGPERDGWDAVFTPDRMARLNAEVFRAQPAVRPERRVALFKQIAPLLFDPAAVARRHVLTDPASSAEALDALPEA